MESAQLRGGSPVLQLCSAIGCRRDQVPGSSQKEQGEGRGRNINFDLHLFLGNCWAGRELQIKGKQKGSMSMGRCLGKSHLSDRDHLCNLFWNVLIYAL